MDESKTSTTEVVKTPLIPSNESETPCNNDDIMNVNNDEVILRKKPSDSVSFYDFMKIKQKILFYFLF